MHVRKGIDMHALHVHAHVHAHARAHHGGARLGEGVVDVHVRRHLLDVAGEREGLHVRRLAAAPRVGSLLLLARGLPGWRFSSHERERLLLRDAPLRYEAHQRQRLEGGEGAHKRVRARCTTVACAARAQELTPWHALTVAPQPLMAI